MIEFVYHIWFFVCVLFILTGCGSKNEQDKASNKFEEVKPLIALYCANCHDGAKQKAFDSEERWLNSNAKKRIENGTMPPNKPLEAEVKKKFLASF